MESWQEKFLQVARKLEEEIDQKRFQLKEKLGLVSQATIQAYRGYGNEKQVFMLGRVLENEGLELPPKNASIWQNLSSLYHRYESDEIPNARIEYKLENHRETITCNKEGFYNINISNPQLSLNGSEKWKKITLRLIEPYQEKQEEVKVEGEIQVPLACNTFGLISDIDDTIMVTKATEFLEKMRIFILRNSHTRKPLEGVAALYRAFEAGKNKNAQNPVFYLSSSSWNLYDVFDQFCQINQIPKGTFLLTQLGFDKDRIIRKGHKHHKLEKILHILDTFPDLAFVLVGDSGQKDPEIYLEVVNKCPDRVKAIYIRDVKPEIPEERDQEVNEICRQVKKKGVEMKLIQNSMEAARHALQLGLISEDFLKEIENESNEEKNLPSDISQLLGLDNFL